MAHPATIHCEICGLPHLQTVLYCENCNHALGTRPDPAIVRGDLGAAKFRLAVGTAAIVLLVALTLVLPWQGIVSLGWAVLFAFPAVMVVNSATEYRRKVAYLRRVVGEAKVE